MTPLAFAVSISVLASVPVFEDFPPVSAGSVSPEITGTADGVLWLSWIEKEGKESARLQVARLKGGAWTEPVTVASGKDLVVNDADIPQVAALPGGGVLVQWLVREGSGTTVKVARAKDADGRKFGAPVILGKAGAGGERGFVRFVAEGKSLRAIWLEDGKLVSAPWLDVEGKFGETATVDEKVCECCQPAIAGTSAGAVALYRDRTDDEIRDISVVRFDETWDASEPLAADGWKMPACPVNGPAIDARGDELVAAWFTGANDIGVVKVAFAKGTAPFGEGQRIDAGKAIGKVAVRWVDATHALATWIEREEDGNALFAAWVSKDKVGEPEMIAAFRAGESRSHPRLAVAGKDLYLAWSDGRGDERKPHLVRVAKLGAPDYSRVRGKRELSQAIDTAEAIEAISGGKAKHGAKTGDMAPEIDGETLDGKRMKLSDLKGKVVLVSFWGAWCGPCRAEVPEHVAMREELKAKGFEIFSVNSGDTIPNAKSFAKEYGIEYPIVLDDGFSQKWKVSGFPTNVVVDRTGKIRGRTQGYSPLGVEKQRLLVEELLAEPAVATP